MIIFKVLFILLLILFTIYFALEMFDVIINILNKLDSIGSDKE